MEARVEQGYILLADISGFDAYLAGVELEHAYGVLEELLELLVHHLTPPLSLATVERDAVLAYAPESRLSRGETLLELTEAAYVAFRRRLTTIHRNSTCNCRACSAVPSLDLKFLVHFGEYVAQPMSAGGVDLGGLDANLVRDRLLKNQVSAANGWRAYALYTEPTMQHIGLEPNGMHVASASYPHVGEIKTAALNLQARFETLTEARHEFVASDEADLVMTQEFTAPPPLLWEWLNDPEKRTRWMKWRTWTARLRPGGRTGVGARNHCAHGVVTTETVLDWRPYDFYTVRLQTASVGVAMKSTYQLEPLEDGSGTRLHIHMRVQEAMSKRLARRMLRSVFPRLLKNDFERLAELLNDERLELHPAPA